MKKHNGCRCSKWSFENPNQKSNAVVQSTTIHELLPSFAYVLQPAWKTSSAKSMKLAKNGPSPGTRCFEKPHLRMYRQPWTKVNVVEKCFLFWALKDSEAEALKYCTVYKYSCWPSCCSTQMFDPFPRMTLKLGKTPKIFLPQLIGQNSSSWPVRCCIDVPYKFRLQSLATFCLS